MSKITRPISLYRPVAYLFDSELLGSVVGLGGLRLNHHRGVTALVVLRAVGDCANDVTRVESDRCTEGGEGGDEDANNDFEDFLLAHNKIFLKGQQLPTINQQLFFF